ncbi:MAG: hypothetical protein MJZ34_16940 [Paludibacteraceae bacterium]|nr:hypothetical protein [Paludibacteraceae bacterium]
MVKENELIDIDVLMNQKFGKEGTVEREKFREEAYNFCVGQMISEARKQEKITQVELAKRAIGERK